jgi:lipopolysaccharide/colanic/teichoic acid biosynthesis glycosyltransferase
MNTEKVIAANTTTEIQATTWNENLYYSLKRAMDIVVSLTMLILLAPLLLVVAVLVKLDSPGSAIFVQERVGSRRRRLSNGKVIWEIDTFHFYKFRSMRQDADESLHKAFIQAFINGGEAVNGELMEEIKENAPFSSEAFIEAIKERKGVSGKKKAFKLAGDPRVTRVGHFIRKTSIDELPQLVNILKGEMSLVGPRPVPTYEFAQYKPEYRKRMNAKQGLTGLWQVKARGRAPFEEQMNLDLEYTESRSLLLDIAIIFLTIPAVVSGRGAK